MYYTYVLQNQAGRFYTGYTQNLRKRLSQHNAGKTGYAGKRGPYLLVYYEACLNKYDAESREQYLKSGMGKRYIKSRLKRFLSLTG